MDPGARWSPSSLIIGCSCAMVAPRGIPLISGLLVCRAITVDQVVLIVRLVAVGIGRLGKAGGGGLYLQRL